MHDVEHPLDRYCPAKLCEMEVAPAWELSKENVQPLKRGRTIESLQAALDAADKEKDEKKRRFEEAIANETDTDKQLKLWHSYVCWLEDVYSSGSSDVLVALEKATVAFLATPRLKNDKTYVDLWMKYAEHIAEPQEVLTFLRLQRIGEARACLWLAIAWAAEKHGDFSEADAAYRTGLARAAEPVAVLATRYREFQRRAIRAWVKFSETRGRTLSKDDVLFEHIDLVALTQHNAATQGASKPVLSSENENVRGALGHLSEKTAARSHRDGLTAQEVVRLSSTQAFGQQAKSTAPKPAPVNNKQVAVFTDEEFAPPVASAAAALRRPGFAVDQVKPGLELKQLGAVAERQKENAQKPATWTSTTLREHAGVLPPRFQQHTTARAPAGSSDDNRIQIFVDEDFSAAEPASIPLPTRPDMPLQPVKSAPTRTFDGAALLARSITESEKPTLQTATSISSTAAKVPVPLSSVESAPPTSPQAKFVSPLLSFEEERAVHWCKKRGIYGGSWTNTHFAAPAVDRKPLHNYDNTITSSERTASTAELDAFISQLHLTGGENTTTNKPPMPAATQASSATKAKQPLALRSDISVAVSSPVSPIPKRSVFRSVARAGRESIGHLDSPILAGAMSPEELTMHTRLAMNDMAELFASPSLARALEKPKMAAKKQQQHRELPPDARRLSMHLAARSVHEQPRKPNFQLYEDEVVVPKKAAPHAPAAFTIFEDS